jgi:PAS domain S-box-containing protein
MLDRNGCFTFLNERVEALLGYRKEELIGRHYSEIIDPTISSARGTPSTSAAPALAR